MRRIEEDLFHVQVIYVEENTYDTKIELKFLDGSLKDKYFTVTIDNDKL